MFCSFSDSGMIRLIRLRFKAYLTPAKVTTASAPAPNKEPAPRAAINPMLIAKVSCSDDGDFVVFVFKTVRFGVVIKFRDVSDCVVVDTYETVLVAVVGEVVVGTTMVLEEVVEEVMVDDVVEAPVVVVVVLVSVVEAPVAAVLVSVVEVVVEPPVVDEVVVGAPIVVVVVVVLVSVVEAPVAVVLVSVEVVVVDVGSAVVVEVVELEEKS